MLKNTIITAIVAALLGAIVVVVATPERVTKEVVREVVEQVGAVASPDIMSPWFGVGGVRQYKANISLRQATTTPIAYLTPAATSTLERASCWISTASTSVTYWVLAKATTPYATTTAFGTEFRANANGTAFFTASTTPGAAAQKDVFAPSSYLVLGARGGDSNGDTTNPVGFVPVGNCVFTFEEVQ